MSTADHREPTNDELWSQPPALAQQAPVPQPPAQQGPYPGTLAPLQPTYPPVPVPPPVRAGGPDRYSFILAIVSLVLAVPLTGAVAGAVPGVVLTWLGIVGVNFAYNFRRR